MPAVQLPEQLGVVARSSEQVGVVERLDVPHAVHAPSFPGSDGRHGSAVVVGHAIVGPPPLWGVGVSHRGDLVRADASVAVDVELGDEAVGGEERGVQREPRAGSDETVHLEAVVLLEPADGIVDRVG